MVFIGNYSEMISIGYDVGVKRSFDPFDTGLLRTAYSHNPQKHSQSGYLIKKVGTLPERPADGVVGVYMSLSTRGWIVVVWGCGRR